MLTTNRYLDFANELIAKYSGHGGAFDQISLIYPQEEKAAEPEAVRAQQNFVTNFYKIQNIREENYLYTKNLTFLTEIMEKRFFQKIYPSVEKQVEKVVREEYHQAENHTVEKFAKMIQKFVEREGAEKLTLLKQQFQSTEHLVETKGQKEQEVLFRKLENIYQSSIYRPKTVVDKQIIHQGDRFLEKHLIQNQTLVFPTVEETPADVTTIKLNHTELLEKWTNTLVKQEIYRETQKQLEKQFHEVSQEVLKENFTNLISRNVTNEIVREVKNTKQFVENQINELTKNILNASIGQTNDVYHEMDAVYPSSNIVPNEAQMLTQQSINYQQEKMQFNQLVQKVQNFQDVQNVQEVQNSETVWNLQNLQKHQNQIDVQQSQLFHQLVEQNQQTNLNQNLHHQMSETVLNYQNEETIQKIENVLTDKAETLIQQNLNYQQEKNQINQLEQIVQISQEVQNHENVWNLQTLQEHENQIIEQKNQLLHQLVEQNQQTNLNHNLQHQMSETILNYQNEEMVQNIENVLAEKNETLIQQELNYQQEKNQINQLEQRVQNLQKVQNHEAVWNLQTLLEQQNQMNVQKSQLLHQLVEQNQQTNLNHNLQHQMSETVLNYQNEETIQNIENVLTEKNESLIQQNLNYQQEKTQLNQLEQRVQNLQKVQNHEAVWNLQTLQEQQNQLNVLKTENAKIQILDQPLYQQIQQIAQTVISHRGGDQTLNYYVDSSVHHTNTSREEVQQIRNADFTSQLYNPQNIYTVQNLQRVSQYQTLQNRMEQHNHQYLMHQTPQEYSLSPVSIVYGEEGASQNASNSEIVNLKRQVDEVVRDLKTVEEKSIVRKQEVTAQQKEIVKEIIKTNSEVLLEGSGQDLIRREVKKSIEAGMPENIQKITNKVYRKLEKELKMERGRRGMN